ncbi:MAG: lysylphosphatidylglycerol synthase transmembrane domain-containing protein [Thermodesulfobacteriota bacterium]|nr:lysylphosphatidylglycerol synthase transmembrane domain-containing protein [Thermodesulfobacteriota bacterium]
MPTLRQQTLLRILTLVAALVVVGIIHHLYSSVQEKSDFVLHPWFLALALGFALVQKALGPVSIMIVFQSLNQRSNYMPLLWITMFSTTANSAVPFPAGIPIRAILQRRIMGIPYATSVSGLVIETALSYSCAAITCLVTGLLWLAPALNIRMAYFQGPLLTGSIVIALLFSFALLYTIGHRLKGNVIHHLQDAARQMVNARHGPLLIVTGLILFSYIISLLRFEMVLQAMGHYAPPGPLLAAMILSYLAGVVSFVPMGLGIRDVSLGSLLVFLGIPLAPAAAAAAIDRILISMPYLIGGGVATHVLGRDVLNLEKL